LYKSEASFETNKIKEMSNHRDKGDKAPVKADPHSEETMIFEEGDHSHHSSLEHDSPTIRRRTIGSSTTGTER
jgi:hypothetical protein